MKRGKKNERRKVRTQSMPHNLHGGRLFFKKNPYGLCAFGVFTLVAKLSDSAFGILWRKKQIIVSKVLELSHMTSPRGTTIVSEPRDRA